MIYPIEVYLERIENAYTTGRAHCVGINSIMRNLTDGIPVHDMPVSDRVIIASKILKTLLQKNGKEWEIEAQNTISRLKEILGDVIKDIQHVGSASIFTIKAKPIY